MTSPGRVFELARQAYTGDIPPEGAVQTADAVIGFSFGTYLDPAGLHAICPGPVNESLAQLIVGNEVIRTLPLTLQEEVAGSRTGQATQ